MRTLPALAILAVLAGAATAADPAPAPAAVPAADPNLVYAFTSKSATFDPEKGTLALKGLSDSVLALSTSATGQESFARREAGFLFGKTTSTPAFNDAVEVVVEGKKGLPAGHMLILTVSSPKLERDTLTFQTAAIKTGNYTVGGLAEDAATRHGEGPIISTAEAATAPVTLDDALTVAHVHRPSMGAALEAHKAKAAKDPVKHAAPAAPAAAAAPPADVAAPAKPPLPAAPAADAAKPPAPAAPAADAAKPPALAAPAVDPAKPPPPAAPKPATAPAPTTAPVAADAATTGRRLLQQNCGVCEYANNSGACVVVGPDNCDGVVGQSGEWACGTCQYFTQDDFEGHCEVADNC